MSREAMKLALEASGEIAWSNETQWQRDRAKKAITAIKEALEQPEPEPVAWTDEDFTELIVSEDIAKDIGATVPLYTSPPKHESEPPSWTPVEIGVDVTPEGAHVVGMYVLMPDAVRYVFYSKFHPNTSPPKREWQGLTDEEIKQIEETTTCTGNESWLRNLTRNIEAKLKEKNGI